MFQKYFLLMIFILTILPTHYPLRKHIKPKKSFEIPEHPLPKYDKNHNKIHDDLEKKMGIQRVIITLANINSKIKRTILHFLNNCKIIGRFVIANASIEVLKELLQSYNRYILFIEPDQNAKLMLYQATRIIGVRPFVWYLDASGRNITVAIIDSGVDVTHKDLANKIIYWYDVTNEFKKPTDPIGHGTFIASIIAGSGIASARGILDVVTTGNTSEDIPTLLFIPETQLVNFTVKWKNMYNANILQIILEHQETNERWRILTTSGYENFSLRLESGFYRVYVRSDEPYAMYTLYVSLKYPYHGWAPMRGVAPKAKLAVIKCVSSDGKMLVSWILEALEKVKEIAKKLGVFIVNLSFGVKYSYALEMAVNDLAKDGIIVVTSAGNEYIESVKKGIMMNQITSPGTARFAITVGGINDLYGISIFSSRGGVYKDSLGKYMKPDLLAPAGGLVYGSWISAADASSSDGLFKDMIKNDYVCMAGTSAAAAVVSGVLADFLEKWLQGHKWNWNLSDVSMIKAFLLSSTFETSYFGKHETNFDGVRRSPPFFNFGDRDYDEGFGSIWAPAMFKVLDVLKIADRKSFEIELNNNSPVVVIPMKLEGFLFRISMQTSVPNASVIAVYDYSLADAIKLRWSSLIKETMYKHISGNKVIFLALKLIRPGKNVIIKIDIIRLYKRTITLIVAMVTVIIVFSTSLGKAIAKKVSKKIEEFEKKIKEIKEEAEEKVKRIVKG